MKHISDEELLAQHTTAAIAERLDQNQSHGTLGDIILGGVDGTVTTFAIISGVAGTGMEKGVLVAFVLGVANVLADGFSMGISNFLKAKSDQQNVERFRKIEEGHIDRIPELEKEEVRQIFARKGFEGDLLEEIVVVVTRDRKLWVDTMLTDEWGLQISPMAPVRSGLLTFGAFVAAGMLPLLPLLLGLRGTIGEQQIFMLCSVVTGFTFLLLGALRGRTLGESVTRSALETLFVGAVAAALAYFAGEVLGGLVR